MLFFNETESNPLQEILKYEPHQLLSKIELIEENMNDWFLAESFNGLLKNILQGGSVDCISVSTFNVDSRTFDWRLCRSEKCSLTLRMIDGEPHKNRKVMHVSANDILLMMLNNAKCKVILYEFEEAYDYDVFDKKRALISRKVINLKKNEIIFLKAGIHALQFVSAKGAIFFESASFKHHSLIWNFDLQSQLMVYPSSANVSSTRAELAIKLIEKIGNSESVEILRNITTNHKHHFVRWKAFETLAVLDVNAAKLALFELARDSHVDVRNAAIKTIEINGI